MVFHIRDISDILTAVKQCDSAGTIEMLIIFSPKLYLVK